MLVRKFSNFTPTLSSYDPKKDEVFIRKIAIENLIDLISIEDTSKSPDLLFNLRVKPLLDHPHCHKKVLHIEDQVVGFISYRQSPMYLKKYAKIEHLAIRSDFQKKGYGSLLLQDALQHLKADKVDFVQLEVTRDEPIPFYQKHGFEVLRYPMLKYKNAGWLILDFYSGKKGFLSQCLHTAYKQKSVLAYWGSYALLFGIMAALPSKNGEKT